MAGGGLGIDFFASAAFFFFLPWLSNVSKGPAHKHFRWDPISTFLLVAIRSMHIPRRVSASERIRHARPAKPL
jgi:hypothetical protein